MYQTNRRLRMASLIVATVKGVKLCRSDVCLSSTKGAGRANPAGAFVCHHCGDILDDKITKLDLPQFEKPSAREKLDKWLNI